MFSPRGSTAAARVLGPFAPSHRPHLRSFFLGADGLRLAVLAVRSLLRQVATADAPLPLVSLGEHSRARATSPSPESSRSIASKQSLSEIRPSASCRSVRRKQLAVWRACSVRCKHGDVTMSSCLRNIRLFSFRKIYIQIQNKYTCTRKKRWASQRRTTRTCKHTAPSSKRRDKAQRGSCRHSSLAPSTAAADLEHHRESPKPCRMAELLGRGKMVTTEVGGARRRLRGEEGHRRDQLAQQQPGASRDGKTARRSEWGGGQERVGGGRGRPHEMLDAGVDDVGFLTFEARRSCRVGLPKELLCTVKY
jgi:hypothetical protein